MTGEAANDLVMSGKPLFQHATVVYHSATWVDKWKPSFVSIHAFRCLKGSKRPAYVLLEHDSDWTCGPCGMDSTAEDGGAELLERAWVSYNLNAMLDYAESKVPGGPPSSS